MNINFTFFNEIISFLIFFIFSYKKIFPLFLKEINQINIINFKKKVLYKYNKTIFNFFEKKIFNKEKNIKNNLTIYFNNINNLILKKKNFLNNLLKNEKKYFYFLIKNKFKNKFYFNIMKYFQKIKKTYLISFKNIYNEIINFNNEFIINYD